jgi:two-component system CheB/CheR fusion protein
LKKSTPPRRRVLLVEDNEDAGDTLRMVLDSLGYEVHLVRDGESAVETAGGLRPHVVLMDIGLPGMNGYEAARKIRAGSLGRKVLMIALTGRGRTNDLEQSAAAGIDHHLVKPLDFEALKRILGTGPQTKRGR